MKNDKKYLLLFATAFILINCFLVSASPLHDAYCFVFGCPQLHDDNNNLVSDSPMTLNSDISVIDGGWAVTGQSNDAQNPILYPTDSGGNLKSGKNLLALIQHPKNNDQFSLDDVQYTYQDAKRVEYDFDWGQTNFYLYDSDGNQPDNVYGNVTENGTFKFGAIDESNLGLKNYTYIINSTDRMIMLRRNNYPIFYNYHHSGIAFENETEHQYNFKDICNKSYADCQYSISEDGLSAIVTFTANGDIDPLIDPITTCGTIDTYGYYHLTQNLYSDSSCIVIAYSDVILDGNNYSIYYGNVSDMVGDNGIELSTLMNNVTIENFRGNYLGYCSDPIYTNQIDCEAVGYCSDGMYDNKIDCEANSDIWTSTNIWTPDGVGGIYDQNNGGIDGGVAIKMSGDSVNPFTNLNISNNYIDISYDSFKQPITISSSTSACNGCYIQNNNISSIGWNGIQFGTGDIQNTIVSDNIINVHGDGISIQGANWISSCSILNNNITSLYSYGIHSSYFEGGLVDGNNIVSGNHGIHCDGYGCMEASYNNIISSSKGIYSANPYYTNLIFNNNIITSVDNGIEAVGSFSNNQINSGSVSLLLNQPLNYLINNTMTSSLYDIYVVEGNNFTLDHQNVTTYDIDYGMTSGNFSLINDFGEIDMHNMNSYAIGTNLFKNSTSDFRIKNNSAFITTSTTAFNYSSTITLNNLVFSVPMVKNNGVVCNSPQCTIPTNVGNNWTFDVLYAGNYSLYETSIPHNATTFYDYSDDSGTLTDNGTGNFKVRINNSNGTAILFINSQNVTATNVSNNFTANYNFTSGGNYSYYWFAYNNVPQYNYTSTTRYYFVNSSVVIPPVVNQSSSDIYTILVSSGAGLGLFMLYLAQSLPLLLLSLVVIVIVIAIGYGIAKLIKNSLKGGKNKNGL